MADPGVEQLVVLKRCSNYASIIPLILYLPIGLALGLVRLCIFLHICLLSYVLPNSLLFKRFIIRTMLSVIGLPISTQGVAFTEVKKNILIANHVSSLDPFILSFIHPSILTIDSLDLLHFQPKPFKRLELPADKDRADIITLIKETVKESKESLLFFPEKFKTNGKSLLTFSQLPFDVDCPIQPITIQVERYLFDFAVSTYSSSAYEDLLWCLILPVTFYRLKHLPVTEKKKDEKREDFANRVQVNVAKSLGITPSSYSHSDVTQFIKKRMISERELLEKHKAKPQDSPQKPATNVAAIKVTASEDSELETMVKQVKEVLPDTSEQLILVELKNTRDVDLTITNILEGKSDMPVLNQECGTSLSQGLSFKASKFETNATARQMSFAERKQAMLEAARLKYRIKHGL